MNHNAVLSLSAGLAIAVSTISGNSHASDYPVVALTAVSNIGDDNDIYFPYVADPAEYTDEFPMIILLPGGGSDKGIYSDYATELAGRGYVVAIANHWRPLGPPGTEPQRFASLNAMVSSMELMQSLDSDPASPIYQIVDESTLGIQGHSFGGALAMWAVEGTCGDFNVFCDSMGPLGPVPYQKPSELKAAVNWATNAYSFAGPFPVLLDPETSANPVVILNGANDTIATMSEALDTYDVLDGSRAVLEFEGMTHYGICNVEDPEGNAADPGEPEISQAEGHRRIAKWSDRFFKAHLYGQQGMTKKIYEKKQGDSGVVVVKSEL